MVATCNKKIMLRIILVSEKELSDINFERLKQALVYINNNSIDSDSNIYLDFHLLADINNIITGWNNITFRTVNVEPHGHEHSLSFCLKYMQHHLSKITYFCIC